MGYQYERNVRYGIVQEKVSRAKLRLDAARSGLTSPSCPVLLVSHTARCGAVFQAPRAARLHASWEAPMSKPWPDLGVGRAPKRVAQRGDIRLLYGTK